MHILFVPAWQSHLTNLPMNSRMDEHNVFFVAQLSTCIPLLRILDRKCVVFYCHFPGKLAHGVFVEGKVQKRNVGILYRIYRYPVDRLEKVTSILDHNLSSQAVLARFV